MRTPLAARDGPLAIGAKTLVMTLLLGWGTLLSPLAAKETGAEESEALRLTLLSFNLWGAGANEGLPIDHTVEALRVADADIVGVQETMAEGSPCLADACPYRGEDRTAALAAALGYYYFIQRQKDGSASGNALLSRHPFVRALPGHRGAVIDVRGRRVHAWNVHATDFPYQPYQLLHIPYGDAPFLDSAEAAVAAARKARGGTLRDLLAARDREQDADLEIVFGDFNEPSHRDWTARAAAAGRHPLTVPFPFTRALEAAGFVDTLRVVHPDELARPAFTWTPTTAPDDPADHHDRIDYVFVHGADVVVESATVVGERGPHTDLAIEPWPSDHRAARATVRWE